MVTVLQLGIFPAAAPAYDLRAISRLIAQAQAEGREVAVTDPYHGQFGFYGRLVRPLEQLDDATLQNWASRHPQGRITSYNVCYTKLLRKLELRQARENRKRAEQELMRAIEVLNRLTIRSPIDGIVIERVASPGESISEEDEILKLAQIDPLNVELIVPAIESYNFV